MHPIMFHKDSVFYRGRTAVSVDFSVDEISSDGAVLLLKKFERKQGLFGYFSIVLPDHRNPFRIVHTVEKLLN